MAVIDIQTQAEFDAKILREIAAALESGVDISLIMARHEGGPFTEYPEIEEEEKETGIMWEIECPVTYYRTFHVPGKNAEDALRYFNSICHQDRYDFFADPEDMIDGEESQDATVRGVSSEEYFNPTIEKRE
jgi:hypothetical protein